MSRAPWLPLAFTGFSFVAILAASQGGCRADCVGEDCEDVPEDPWDPGDDTGSDDAYGYGDTDDTDDTDDDLLDTAEPPEEIVSVRSCEVVLRHSKGSGVSTLEVQGEFNDWSPEELTGPDEDGYHYVELGELDPGEYAYELVEDGVAESSPPVNVYTKWLDEVEYRNLRVGDCTLPLLQTVSAEATSSGTVTAEIQFGSAEDASPIDPDSVTVMVGSQEVTPDIEISTGEIRVDVSGLDEGKHSVWVWASDEEGREAENNPLFIPLWVESEPFEWADALMYFAFTDRFRDGDYDAEGFEPIDGVEDCANYNGGDFLGIMHAMEEDYFLDLGVDTLWISPVYENPDGAYIGIEGEHYFTGYHGYWPVEPDGIEERFGDYAEGSYTSGEDRLREMIDAAHAKGIRVLFDMVLNHVHEDHVYVSEHPDWFEYSCTCGDDGCGWESEAAIDCWFIDYLPDLNYRNHEVVMQVVEDTLDLVRTYDVDALRIDASKHMNHVIMRTLRMRLQDDFEAGGGAEIYLVGEAYTGDRDKIAEYVADYELNGQFDFALYYSIRETFTEAGSFSSLDSSAADSEAAFGDALMSPFLGNHDVDRFASAYDGEAGDCWSDSTTDPMADGGSTVTEWDLINAQSMAFAFTLTQPGVPLIYYGDEIGLHGMGDPDNRRVMSFGDYLSANQEELLQRVQAIGTARRESEALRRGERQQLWVDDDYYVYALDNGGGDVALVAMNKSGSTRTETVNVSSLDVSGATFTDALGSGLSVTVSGGEISLPLDDWQYAILTR